MHHASLWHMLGGASSTVAWGEAPFTEDLDDGAPEQLKSNHRNNMDRHVFKNDEFMAMALESDSH